MSLYRSMTMSSSRRETDYTRDEELEEISL
jgi:hypothetical protein